MGCQNRASVQQTTRHGKSENRLRQSELLEPALAKSENNNAALLSDRNQQDNTASLPPISQTELSEPCKRSTEPRQCKAKQEWERGDYCRTIVACATPTTV